MSQTNRQTVINLSLFGVLIIWGILIYNNSGIKKDQPKKQATDEITINGRRVFRAFKDAATGDSVFIYTDGIVMQHENRDQPPLHRYFLFSYVTQLKNSVDPITGDFWFRATGFPSKNEFDSLVYASLKYKKSCYQNIIVTGIYEFKNEEDFEAFGKSGSTHYYKNHEECRSGSSLFFDSRSRPYIPPQMFIRDAPFMKIDSGLMVQRDDSVEILYHDSPAYTIRPTDTTASRAFTDVQKKKSDKIKK